MSSEAGEGASTSATPTKEQMEAKTKAQDLLAKGKRNLICNEVPAAVQQFQDACQMLTKEFGDMGKECAEAYFHYGSALLDLARMEQGVLGNALDGVDVDADDEAGPDNKEQFESPDNLDAEASEKKMEGTEEAEGEEEGDEMEEDEEEGEEEGQEEGEDEENADDIPNLQLSWEVLEMAKVLYTKDESEETQLKLADTYLKLGEVGLEGEQYDQAIQDFESCLNIRKKRMSSSDRAIAETYYQLGLACQMGKQLDKAKESFAGAVTSLEEKMVELKKIVEEKPAKSPSDTLEPAESAQREIKEILEILPEIKEKVSETEEEKRDMETIKTMTKQAMGSIFCADSTSESKTEIGFGGASSSSPEKSADSSKTLDINHLIRKKRKPEEEEKKEEEDLENKKQRQGGASGDAGLNGVSQKKETTSEAVAAT